MAEWPENSEQIESARSSNIEELGLRHTNMSETPGTGMV